MPYLRRGRYFHYFGLFADKSIPIVWSDGRKVYMIKMFLFVISQYCVCRLTARTGTTDHLLTQSWWNETWACGQHTSLWASCQICKIAGAHAPGISGTFSPPPRISHPDMHHGTCVTHVPWCMPGSLTSGFLWSRLRGKTFPAFPAHVQPAILRI